MSHTKVRLELIFMLLGRLFNAVLPHKYTIIIHPSGFGSGSEFMQRSPHLPLSGHLPEFILEEHSRVLKPAERYGSAMQPSPGRTCPKHLTQETS